MTPAEREALVQDCAMQIGKLGIQCDLLEKDKSDPVVAQELKILRSNRAAAEVALRDLLAQGRDQDAAAAAALEAEAARRAEHLEAARRLGAERQQLCKAIDASLAAFAGLLASYHQAASQQADELVMANERMAAEAARPRARSINAALRLALVTANVPTRAIEIPHLSGNRIETLAAGDAIAVEPDGGV